MGLQLIEEALDGLRVFQPNVFEDERGFFMETYKECEFRKFGLPTSFVQDNHSRSTYGVIRGMHFQWDHPQGKLIRATRGKAFVVEIDLRKNSPHLGRWFSIELSEDNKKVLWVPPGFANGFCSLSDITDIQYKCTAEWNKNGESNILWNDSEVGINWPIEKPFLSDKDSNAQTLREWLKKPESENFRFL